MWHITPDSFARWRHGRSHNGFFCVAYLWLCMPKSKWQGQALQRGRRGCFWVPSRRSPVASVGERVTALLPLHGDRGGLIACCHQTPWGEPLWRGTASSGNKLSRFVAGPFPVRSRIKGDYVSNLCCMRSLSPITHLPGEPVSGSRSTGLTLGRVSGEAAFC